MGIFSLFAWIILLTGVLVTYTGNQHCGVDCYSYVNVTSTYWRICFGDDFNLVQTNPDVPVDVYVPTTKSKAEISNEKGHWRDFNPTNDCIERYSKKYHPQPNRFMIVGHKERTETVKWGIDRFDIDPIWIGSEKKIILINYTYNTKTTKYEDGVTNMVVYSKIKFADSIGTPIEHVKSLLDCEFCNHIKLTKKIEEKYPIRIIDYNLTHINICVGADGKQLIFGTPLRVLNKYDKTDIIYSKITNFKSLSDEECQVIPFGFDKEIHFGESSTILTLDSDNGDLLEDSHGCASASQSNDERGGATTAYLQPDTAWEDGQTEEYMLKWNVSKISGSSEILDSQLYIYIEFNTLEPGETLNSSVYHIYNNYSIGGGDWTEGTETSCGTNAVDTEYNYDDRPGTGYFNPSPDDVNILYYTNTSTLESWNITDMVSTTILNNYNDFTLMIKHTNISGSPDKYDYIGYTTKESAFYTNPILNITYKSNNYSLNIINTSTYVTPNTVEIFAFNFTKNYVGLTTNIIVNNISIGGEVCNLSTSCYGSPSICSTWNSVESTCNDSGCVWDAAGPCSGSPDVCSTHSTESPCEIAGCTWTVDSTNNTDKACGNDCHGGDETYPSTASCTNYILADSCSGASSCDGTDSVVDITLNGTSFLNGDIIGVSMDVMCYGTGDEIKIWYYNGSGWSEEFYDSTCAAQGKQTVTDSITINSATTVQYIRGQVTYNTLSGDDECFTGTYGDNDDINFTIVGGTGSCEGIADGCGNHTETTNCTTSGCDWDNSDCSGTADGCGNFTFNVNCTTFGCTDNDGAWYVSPEWLVNCTVASGCTGTSNDLYINATFTNDSVWRNDTASGIISCSAGNPDTNFTIWDGSNWVDSLTGGEYITFRCTPTQTDCEPDNQIAGSSQSIYQICNNGTASGTGVYLNINETITNIAIECDDDYTVAGATTLTTSNQSVHGTLVEDACINVCCWSDYTSPTAGGFFDVNAHVYE